jgi:hypothetical protein
MDRALTTGELIEQLTHYPSNTVVAFEDRDHGPVKVRWVTFQVDPKLGAHVTLNGSEHCDNEDYRQQ